MKELIRKWALDNARRYDGIASPGAVVGKLIAEDPGIKSQLKELMPIINEVLKEVNALSQEQQIEELQKTAPELLEEKKIVEEKVLKELPDAKQGAVVLRAAPSASGPLHIGHALAFSLSIEYARKYAGKVILRIEDTNPENIYPQAYEMLAEDFKWLAGDALSEVVIQSDHLEDFYDSMHELLQQGNAYVCTCDADSFRTLINKKEACPCRAIDTTEHLFRWDKMFVEFEPGQAVVRMKTSVDDPNPAMRDWPAMRINHTEHARQGTKYKVWPLMNFSVSIDDKKYGITHTIRGKDHMDNARRQAQVFSFFNWMPPHHSYFGRINFVGLNLSTSETKKKIEYGEFTGWDDIRLPFLPALRRRGYQPESFHAYAVHMGINANDKTIEAEEFFKMLNAFNRDIIDPVADRYFFVADPVKIVIEDAPEIDAQAPLHPDEPERGFRSFHTHNSFHIAKDDHNQIKNQLCRLMHCLNFKKEGEKFVFDSQDADAFREKGGMIMHWLSDNDELLRVEVKMPDGSTVEGLGEYKLKELKEGAIIQFERFGFCRLDQKGDGKLVFWFAHK